MLKEGHSLVYMQKHTDTHILEECVHVSMCTHIHICICLFMCLKALLHAAMKEMCVLTFECGIIFKL